jgi:RimJ/RimL family protein N-acetyltransferase
MVNSKETNGITDFVIVLLREGDGDGDDILQQSSNSPRTTTTESSISRSTDSNAPAIGKIGIFSPLILLESDFDSESLSPAKSGELGFLLNRTYHRRGLVSEALIAVLDYLFSRKGVDAITTDVDPRNQASIGILEKHGFVLTGRKERTWKVGGKWVDSEYRTLTRRGWES